MVVVRLSRGGAKKHPFYHIVVTDSRRPRDSGYIENLGYFNPSATEEETPVFLNRDRFDYWLSQGAKSSQRVSSIISKLDKGKFTAEERAKEKKLKAPKKEATAAKVESSDTDKKAETGTEQSTPVSVQTELELQEDKQNEKPAETSVEASPEAPAEVKPEAAEASPEVPAEAKSDAAEASPEAPAEAKPETTEASPEAPAEAKPEAAAEKDDKPAPEAAPADSPKKSETADK